jgi:hypothetical protein
MIEFYPSIDGTGDYPGEPDEDSLENVLEVIRLTRLPAIEECSLEDTDQLAQLSRELTAELARDVRGLLVHHKFKDAGMFESEDVDRLGYDICANPLLLEKLINIAKQSAGDKEVSVTDLLRVRKEADYLSDQRELTHTAYGLMIWLEIVDEEDLRQIYYNGTADDHRNLQRFARKIVSPAMIMLLVTMQKTVERSGRKFKFQEALSITWHRAKVIDREQSAIDEGDEEALERRRKLLSLPAYEQAVDELAARSELEPRGFINHEIPRPDDN